MALRKALSYAGQALHILKLLNSECLGMEQVIVLDAMLRSLPPSAYRSLLTLRVGFAPGVTARQDCDRCT